MNQLWRTLTGRRTSSLVSPELGQTANGRNGERRVSRIETVALSSAGCVRQDNEDSISLVCIYDRQSAVHSGVMAVVADGMGGAQGGKFASQMATEVAISSFLNDSEAPPIALNKALSLANQTIHDFSKKDSSLDGMGTTCVAVVLTPELAWVAWVGDSRLYLLRDRRIFQMTEDHSIAAELVRGGVMTHAQALCYEDRHVLTRALGTRPDVEVACWNSPMAMQPGDRLLLCTDGLHDPVADTELLALATLPSIEAAGAALINRASEQGGYDNISCILLDVRGRAEVETI